MVEFYIKIYIILYYLRNSLFHFALQIKKDYSVGNNLLFFFINSTFPTLTFRGITKGLVIQSESAIEYAGNVGTLPFL